MSSLENKSQQFRPPAEKFSKKLFLHKILGIFNFFYFWFLRASFKWLMHVWTGRCEIERIIDSNRLSVPGKTANIEHSLVHSKRPEMRQMINSCPVQAVDCCVDLIARAKYIGKTQLEELREPLRGSLIQILGYHQLLREVEYHRKVKFDWDVDEHKGLLFSLWLFLKPETELTSNISRQWTEIGFQGENPATDFRGMGLLGLQQLAFFCEFAPESAKKIFSQSLHPKIGFPFAIAGISMTSLTRELLQQGFLKSHFYSSVRGPAKISDFHRAYCSIFFMFSDAWRLSNPESVMEFNRVRQLFYEELCTKLNDDINYAMPEVTG